MVQGPEEEGGSGDRWWSDARRPEEEGERRPATERRPLAEWRPAARGGGRGGPLAEGRGRRERRWGRGALGWVGAAAGTREWGRKGTRETLESRDDLYKGCYCVRTHMSAGLRVRILNFQTRYEIPVGFRVVPAPAGTNPNPNPRPAGRVSAGTRVFCIRCHLYSPSPPLPHRRPCLVTHHHHLHRTGLPLMIPMEKSSRRRSHRSHAHTHEMN